MAVTLPTPPNPPTPPAVPAVTLGGGGSVTESTVPQSGHQSDAHRQEAQARQSVARGDGALSRTTQEQPQPPTVQKRPVDGSAETQTTVQVDPQAAAAMQTDGSQNQHQSSEAAAPQPEPAHGAGYWAGTLAVVLVLTYVIFWTVMKRKKGGAGLSFRDIQAADDSGSDDMQQLRGLTPDEVLQQLAETESDEIRVARAVTKARLREAGKMPVQPDPPKAAVPKHAARQYRDQLTTMLPSDQPPIVQRPMPKKDEAGHFEVRV